MAGDNWFFISIILVHSKAALINVIDIAEIKIGNFRPRMISGGKTFFFPHGQECYLMLISEKTKGLIFFFASKEAYSIDNWKKITVYSKMRGKKSKQTKQKQMLDP